VLRIVNKDRTLPLEVGSGLILTGSETSVVAGLRYFAAGASYVRPKSIEVPGRKAIRVTDHLMNARLAMLMLVLVVTLWRQLDDRKQ